MDRNETLGDMLKPLHKSGIDLHLHSSSVSLYYEFDKPFTLQVAVNDPDIMEDSYQFAVYAPDLEVHLAYPKTTLSKSKPMHHMNCMKFMYVLEGMVTCIIENNKVIYTSGSCYLVSQNIRHTETFDTYYKVIFFTIKDEFLERLQNYGKPYIFDNEAELGNNITMQYLCDNSKTAEKTFIEYSPILHKQESLDGMQSILNQIIQTLLNHEFGSTFRIQELFCQMINILSSPEYYHISQIQLFSKTDAIIFNRIRNLLEDSNGRISRAEIVRTLNYSSSYISHIVKKHTGMSLYDLSMSICLAKAADLLLSTNKTVTEIMEELKFVNRTHFYQLFQEKYGCTPKNYRKANGILNKIE